MQMRVQSLGQKDPLEEGMATHSSASCLENIMNKGAWRATVLRVAKRWTRLKQLSTHKVPFVSLTLTVRLIM